MTCTDCDTVDRCPMGNAILLGYIVIDTPRLRYCWPSEKSKSNFTWIILCQDAQSDGVLFKDALSQMHTHIYFYARLMECCPKVDFPWKRLSTQASKQLRSVVQNNISVARCEKHNSSNLMDYCSKVDFPW